VAPGSAKLIDKVQHDCVKGNTGKLSDLNVVLEVCLKH